MWSSLTLRRSKDATDNDTTAGGDKDQDTANQKLTRAATFCYQDNYNVGGKKQKNWLKNLPRVRRRFSKHKSDKWQAKCEKEKTVDNCVAEQDRKKNVERIKILDKIRCKFVYSFYGKFIFPLPYLLTSPEIYIWFVAFF